MKDAHASLERNTMGRIANINVCPYYNAALIMERNTHKKRTLECSERLVSKPNLCINE